MSKYTISELIEYVEEMQGEADLEWGTSKKDTEKCEEVKNRLLELEKIKGGKEIENH